MAYHNLNNFGFCFNASFFVCSMTLLMYGVYKKPDYATSDKIGILYALLIIIPIFFSCIIKTPQALAL